MQPVDANLKFWSTWVIGVRITIAVSLLIGFAMFCGAVAASVLYGIVAVLPAELFFHTTRLEDYTNEVALLGCVVWGFYLVGRVRENLAGMIAWACRFPAS